VSRPGSSGAVQRRGISTVLDAALFVLLVSVAIGILYTVPQPPADGGTEPDLAAGAATTIATSIHSIEYTPGPEGDAGPERVERGTLAELLAATTLANADVGGESFTAAPNHTAAVRAATTSTVDRFGGDLAVQVRTRWRPLEGSGFRGGVVVGPDPPASADVHAATLEVPVGTAAAAGPTTVNWTPNGTRDASVTAGNGSPASATAPPAAERPTTGLPLETVGSRFGCEGVARAVARRVVGATLPPEQMRTALLAGGTPESSARDRYERAGDAVGLDADLLPPEPSAREYNAILGVALADLLEPTACDGYDSDWAAGSHARPETVTVAIRVWSP